MIDPILEKRQKEEDSPSFGGDRYNYIMSQRDLIMDENEKKQYSKHKYRNGEYEFIQVAEDICRPGNELKGVKIHDFQSYMNNEIILEHCARTLL